MIYIIVIYSYIFITNYHINLLKDLFITIIINIMVLEEDFLENDQPIPGQNFVCLSFVSPADNIAKKEELYMKEFLKKYCEELGLDLEKAIDFVKKYEDFKYSNSDGLNELSPAAG